MFVRIPRTAALILAIFFGTALLAPLPYVVLTPGSAANILEKTITPSKSAPKSLAFYPSDGELYLLSILISNPSAYVTSTELIYSWMRSDFTVMPRSLFYRDGRDPEVEKKIAKTEMFDSQITAKSVALEYLKENYPEEIPFNIAPSDIDISLARTGGPSGGMAFAIGIIELLTRENILQGRRVATTGTMSAQGKVGSIGGVAEKILAAKKAGATIFLIPRANCSDLSPKFATIPDGIKVVPVASLDEAISALNSKVPQGCANLGA